eukprot:768431-Hanusia_phi.AAC.18
MTMTWSYESRRRRGNSARERACNGGGAEIESDLGRMIERLDMAVTNRCDAESKMIFVTGTCSIRFLQPQSLSANC